MRVQRSHSRPPRSLPSKPQREQSKVWENPAQVVQIALPSTRWSPGRARSWPHPGQVPRVRTARSKQVRQTYPSGQVAALYLRRLQRQHSAMYQRSYCSSVA